MVNELRFLGRMGGRDEFALEGVSIDWSLID
jgi:hypothetical protein